MVACSLKSVDVQKFNFSARPGKTQSECPITEVTIFSSGSHDDAVEVTRRFEFAPVSAGACVVVISDLPEDVTSRMVTISGQSENESICVEEVTDVDRHVPRFEDDKEQRHDIAELIEEIERVEEAINSKTAEGQANIKNQELVNSFVEGMLTTTKSNSPPVTTMQATNDLFLRVLDVLQFQSERHLKLQSQQRDLQKSIAEMNQTKRALIETLRGRMPGGIYECRSVDELVKLKLDVRQQLSGERRQTRVIKDIVVDLTIPSACVERQVRMAISYRLFHRASWRPEYDVRVVTTSPSGERQTKISYFARVDQTTGEDWNDVTMHLSTAEAGMSSSMPPALATRTVDYKVPPLPPPPQMAAFGARAGGGVPRARAMKAMANNIELCAMEMDTNAPIAYNAMAVERHSGAMASFASLTVNRPVMMKHGDAPPKLPVGTVELSDVQVIHYLAPQADPRAYIMVKGVNTSKLPLLESSTVSIYVDGKYLCQTQLPECQEGEDIHFFLGTDSGICVAFNKDRKQDMKETGYISKAKGTTFTSSVQITNTKDADVVMLLAQQVPRSANETIQVKIANIKVDFETTEVEDWKLIPDLVKLKKKQAIGMNKATNHLVRLLQLPSRTKEEFPLTYTVEWPNDKDVQYIDN